MKALLLVLFCFISISASAQWFPIGFHKRYPQIAAVKMRPFKMPAAKITAVNVLPVNLPPSEYVLTISEHSVMKTAQHQMRFREYEDASYSFNELAKIYVQLNKLSEAKWFFLQSNNLSRQQNNDRLTIANLMELASVKQAIGDFALAQQDLDEARGMATSHNWPDDIALVKKRMDILQRSKMAFVKPQGGFIAAQTTL
jgi:hypothetical protein